MTLPGKGNAVYRPAAPVVRNVRRSTIMPNSAELYLTHLDAITGGIEPTIRRIESTQEGLRPVFVFTYGSIRKTDRNPASLPEKSITLPDQPPACSKSSPNRSMKNWINFSPKIPGSGSFGILK